MQTITLIHRAFSQQLIQWLNRQYKAEKFSTFKLTDQRKIKDSVRRAARWAEELKFAGV